MKLPLDKNVPLASNQEWEAWGKLDPLYGVATIKERAKSGANPWTEETFYELGAMDWKFFRAKWEQYGLRPGACVEIGCGAGRMSIHLAQYFETVHGVDISAGMIDYARRRMPANVSLHVTQGTEIPLPDQSVDAVFSTHVLQHLSNTAATAAYFREMGRVLRPGGTIMLHVPIIAWPWGKLVGVHKLVHKVKGLLDGGHAQVHRLAFRLGMTETPPMQVNWYEISWLYSTLQRCGFDDIEIRVLVGGSKMAVQHPFIFARTPVAGEATHGE
jgi:ubiquinone/menaquinone biosynthesis C-methylase UbiE